MKTNPWRDSKLFPSQSVLRTAELCTTEAGSVYSAKFPGLIPNSPVDSQSWAL